MYKTMEDFVGEGCLLWFEVEEELGGFFSFLWCSIVRSRVVPWYLEKLFLMLEKSAESALSFLSCC